MERTLSFLFMGLVLIVTQQAEAQVLLPSETKIYALSKTLICYEASTQSLGGAVKTRRGYVDAISLVDILKRRARKASTPARKERLSVRASRLARRDSNCAKKSNSVFGTGDQTPKPSLTPTATPSPTPSSTIPTALVGQYRASFSIGSDQYSYETFTLTLGSNGTFKLETSGSMRIYSSTGLGICAVMAYYTSSEGAASYNNNLLSLTPSYHEYRNTGHNCWLASPEPADVKISVTPFTVRDEIQLWQEGEYLTFWGSPYENEQGETRYAYGLCDVEHVETDKWPVCPIKTREYVTFTRIQ